MFESSGVLDGKEFVVDWGLVGTRRAYRDVFVFRDGKFQSTTCEHQGFVSGVYSVTPRFSETEFTAECTNSDGSRMIWSGVVRGDELQGSAVYLGANDRRSDYWFQGRLRVTESRIGEEISAPRAA